MWISRATWLEQQQDIRRLRDEVAFLRGQLERAAGDAGRVIDGMERIVGKFLPEFAADVGVAADLNIPMASDLDDGMVDWTDFELPPVRRGEDLPTVNDLNPGIVFGEDGEGDGF